MLYTLALYLEVPFSLLFWLSHACDLKQSHCSFCLDILLIYFYQNGLTPLLAACKRGDTETAQLLIDKGADINKEDEVCLLNGIVCVTFVVNFYIPHSPLI